MEVTPRIEPACPVAVQKLAMEFGEKNGCMVTLVGGEAPGWCWREKVPSTQFHVVLYSKDVTATKKFRSMNQAAEFLDNMMKTELGTQVYRAFMSNALTVEVRPWSKLEGK